jgi:hypothetical protein
MATSQQKRAAAATKEKKPESKKNPETKTLSYPPPSIVMPSNTLIRTDLKEHFEWKDSQRPSLDPRLILKSHPHLKPILLVSYNVT